MYGSDSKALPVAGRRNLRPLPDHRHAGSLRTHDRGSLPGRSIKERTRPLGLPRHRPRGARGMVLRLDGSVRAGPSWGLVTEPSQCSSQRPNQQTSADSPGALQAPETPGPSKLPLFVVVDRVRVMRMIQLTSTRALFSSARVAMLRVVSVPQISARPTTTSSYHFFLPIS